MIDYRINTFLTLYREMNYRKTAEILNMTQPGVTQHIHFLEKEYNTRLFIYDKKNLYKTPAADLLKRSVERMMAEEAALKKIFQNTDEVYLRVGATKTIGEFVILPMAEQFLSYPQNRMDLIVDNTAQLLTMLENGELDFALIEGTFDKGKYDFCLFQKEHFVGICGKSHPFAGRKVALEELFSETLFVREKGSGTRGILEQLLKDHSYSLDSFQRIMTVSNFAAIQHFVAKGQGITFAYAPVAETNRQLATFEIKDVEVMREFNYVYLNEHIAAEQIRYFAAHVAF